MNKKEKVRESLIEIILKMNVEFYSHIHLYVCLFLGNKGFIFNTIFLFDYISFFCLISHTF